MSEFPVSIGGARLFGMQHGTGRPIVCLHAGVADSRMWEPQMDALSQDHLVLAYDRRGFGETTAPNEEFSQTEDLAAVLDHFGIEKAILMGCSQGGRIALDFALEHPDRVEALILVSTALSGEPEPAIPDDLLYLVDRLEAAEEMGDFDAMNEVEAHLWLDGPYEHAGRVPEEIRDLFLDMNDIALRAPKLTMAQEPAPVGTRAKKLAMPVLLLHGDLDFPHVQDVHKRLAKDIPNAKAEIIPDAAHLLTLERPNASNDLLKAFLASL